MAVTATPVLPQAPKRPVVQILPADTTTLKTLFTAGANGSKVVSITAASDDTSNRTLQMYVTRSGTDYLLGTVVCTTLAGTDGATPLQNLLSALLLPGLPKDNDGQVYLFLESGDVLKVKSTVTVTAAKTIHLAAIGADF